MRHNTRDRDNADTCGGRNMRREGNPAFKHNLLASRVVCGLGSCKARVCGIFDAVPSGILPRPVCSRTDIYLLPPCVVGLCRRSPARASCAGGVWLRPVVSGCGWLWLVVAFSVIAIVSLK